MDSIDLSAAQAFQTVRNKLRTGPWNTGELGEKGFVVTEIVSASDQGATLDGIKRYTDKYLQRKTIGRTAKEFPIQPKFLPTDLYKAAGLAAPKTQSVESRQDRLSKVERLRTIEDTDQPEDKPKDEEEDGDNEENPEDMEEEFEELEDDDYNAEKYFDDGDDYGDGDDGDNEAAY